MEALLLVIAITAGLVVVTLASAGEIAAPAEMARRTQAVRRTRVG